MAHTKPLRLLFALLLATCGLSAQPQNPDPPDPTPFGGLVVLAVAGAAYGASRAVKAKKIRDL